MNVCLAVGLFRFFGRSAEYLTAFATSRRLKIYDGFHALLLCIIQIAKTVWMSRIALSTRRYSDTNHWSCFVPLFLWQLYCQLKTVPVDLRTHHTSRLLI